MTGIYAPLSSGHDSGLGRAMTWDSDHASSCLAVACCMLCVLITYTIHRQHCTQAVTITISTQVSRYNQPTIAGSRNQRFVQSSPYRE